MAEVKDYVKRMIDEREEYTEFIEKTQKRHDALCSFIKGDLFETLTPIKKKLLQEQEYHMRMAIITSRKLRGTLSDRIYEEQRNA